MPVSASNSYKIGDTKNLEINLNCTFYEVNKFGCNKIKVNCIFDVH
jgi:hypothetical protein